MEKVGMLSLLVLAVLLVLECGARELRVLNIAWLTNGKTIVDTASYTASLWIPFAIQHFNNRSNAVLPLSSMIDASCNVTLTLVDGVHDDEQLPRKAMKEFILRAERADVLLGPVLSFTTLPVAVGAAALDMPQVSFGASADDLSDKSDYPTFFRIGSTDAQSGTAYASLFDYYGFKKVGLIASSNQFGLAIKTALQRECRSRGIELYIQEYDNEPGPVMDDQAYAGLRTMKSLRLNVILYAAIRFEFIYSLAQAAEKLDWTIGKLYISHIQLADFGKLNADQIAYSYRFLNSTLHVQPSVDPANTGLAKMKLVWPTLDPAVLNAVLPENLRVVSNFTKLGQQAFGGRGWAWAYDSVITIGLAACGPKPTLIENLRDVKFVGASGRVDFMENQDRDPDAFYYVLSNLITTKNGTSGTQPVVASLGDKGIWNFTKEVWFSDGTTSPPVDSNPPVNIIDTIPFGAKIYGWIICAIGILASLLVLGYTIHHRKERIMVESQPLYLALLAVGAGLMAASIIALTIESNGGCMGFPWVFSMGLTLAMASLAVKSARISLYWRHRGKVPPFKRILGTKILPATMWLILFVDIAIMIAWQVTAPWTLMMVVLAEDEFKNPIRSSMVCTSSDNLASVFVGVLIGYMILIALITGWISFRVRNAPRRYHEAKMTALAGVSMFQVFLVSAPAAFAVWIMALPRFLVLSSMSFVLCLIILVTMFAPKIFKERFLGTMAAKTAATRKKKDEPSTRVTFGAKTQHIVKESDSPHGSNNSDEAKRTTPPRPIDLAPARPVADWKLMILGIKSEYASDSESPPEHEHVPESDSPPEHEQHELSPVQRDRSAFEGDAGAGHPPGYGFSAATVMAASLPPGTLATTTTTTTMTGDATREASNSSNSDSSRSPTTVVANNRQVDIV